MAHAVEGIYAQDASPIYNLMALEALQAERLHCPQLRQIHAMWRDATKRFMVHGFAVLCWEVLACLFIIKLCHTLGGALDLPHAETHAILLPHTVNFVEQAIPQKLSSVAKIFDAQQAGVGLYDFAKNIDAPMRLADIGVKNLILIDLPI